MLYIFRVSSNSKAIKVSDSFLSENRWVLGGFVAGMLIGFSVA